MEKEIMNLPLIIGGKEVESDNHLQFEYEDLIIRFPSLDDNTRKDVLGMDQDSIHDLRLSDIISFLQKVSRLWYDEKYPLRQKLLEYGPRISGTSAEMYKHNIAVLLQLISFKGLMYDIVDYELGDKRLLDEWVPRENSEIHAEPLGRLLHIISGNVSIVGFYSIVRGLLTKNVNIVKLSQRDFLASYLFIRSFADIDPEHPVTKAVSAVYWDKADIENIEYFCNAANGMVVWGGFDTIKAYKSRCPVGCEFIEYGPKKGLQIIDYDNNDVDQLELNVARDVSVFDQEACLSPQIILIKGGDIERFALRLMKGLLNYSVVWPLAKQSDDHFIHKNYLIEAHEYLGNTVYTDDERDWLMIRLNDPTSVNLDHPLGRTIFIKEIQDFDECLDYIDGNVQTVGIAPQALARELRDKLTRRGVSRISDIGNVELPREGVVHEGISLHRLVRIVGMEREIKYYSKYYDIPEDYFDQFPIWLRWV